jgi:hypothetical protein
VLWGKFMGNAIGAMRADSFISCNSYYVLKYSILFFNMCKIENDYTAFICYEAKFT